MGLGIGVSTQNRKALLLECLNAVWNFSSDDALIVIGDDASSDGTHQAIQEWIDQRSFVNKTPIEVLTHPEILGISNNKNRIVSALMKDPAIEDIILIEDDVIPIAPQWCEAFIETARIHTEAHLLFMPSESRYGPTKVAQEDQKYSIAWRRHCAGMCMYWRASLLREVGNFEKRFGRYGWEHNLQTAKSLAAQWHDPEGPYPHCVAVEPMLKALDMERAAKGKPELSTCGTLSAKMLMASHNHQVYSDSISVLRAKYSDVEKKSNEDKKIHRMKYFQD